MYGFSTKSNITPLNILGLLMRCPTVGDFYETEIEIWAEWPTFLPQKCLYHMRYILMYQKYMKL